MNRRDEVINKIKKAFNIKKAEMQIDSARLEFDNLYKDIFKDGKGKRENSDSFNQKFIRMRKFNNYPSVSEIVLMEQYLNISLMDDFIEIAEEEIAASS